jgi:hypothetical protein
MMAWSRSNGCEGRLLQAGRFALISLREFNLHLCYQSVMGSARSSKPSARITSSKTSPRAMREVCSQARGSLIRGTDRCHACCRIVGLLSSSVSRLLHRSALRSVCARAEAIQQSQVKLLRTAFGYVASWHGTSSPGPGAEMSVARQHAK